MLGYLHWWNAYLDPVTMVAVIMTTGLSVDFTVHIAYHYQRTAMTIDGDSHEDASSQTSRRLFIAFSSVGLSMIEAGVSTGLVLAPVLFSPIGAYAIIAKAIVLVVIIGLLHGIFIVPAILALLPNRLTGVGLFWTTDEMQTANGGDGVQLKSMHMLESTALTADDVDIEKKNTGQ